MSERLLAVLLVVVFIFCCSSCGDGVRLHSDHRSDYDFTAVESFALMPMEPDVKTLLSVDPITVDRLRGYAAAELEARQLQRLPPAQADLLLSVLVNVEGKVDVIPYGYHYDPWDPWYRHHGGYRSIHYQEGTLLIDLIDRESRDVVWRGTARRRLGPDDDEEINRALVRRVLEAFPPSS